MTTRDLPLEEVVPFARWGARIASAILFVTWGAFFIDHLEWFTHPGEWPPPKVTALVALHLVMLLSLLVGWRWELLGAVLLLGSSTVFFAAAAAGWNVVLFTALTNLPTVGWLFCAFVGRSRKGSAP